MSGASGSSEMTGGGGGATVGETLRIERTFAASAERVFAAWTSEEVLRRWFHAGPDWETSEATVDLRVGGAVHIVMRDPGKPDWKAGGGGHYTVVEPPRRLAFTWTWDDEERQTLIEVEFEESTGGGATTVRFTHSGLESEERVRDHESGWNQCLDNLARALRD